MRLYFVPTRVADEYRDFVSKPYKHTIPIIKRKLTAMIHATKWCRELIDEEKNIYKHYFNGITLIVDEDNYCVVKVSKKPYSLNNDERSGSYYHDICKRLGLNSERNDFTPEGKEQEKVMKKKSSS